jgi:imidazole glycerol-phosphate synthase subunit HisF
VKNPQLISDIASRFGSQCVVVAIDTEFLNDDWTVFINGGRIPTSLKAIDWAVKAEQLGAGEILLTSMQSDGTKDGFSIDITGDIVKALNIPLIASGGAGSKEDFKEVFEKTGCSAALAASVFHFGEISIPELKRYLLNENINIRI